MPRPDQASVAPAYQPWNASSLMTQPSQEARFAIDRDSLGHWTVTDRDDHVGGTFVSLAAAFSFARQEANNDMTQVCCRAARSS